MQTRAGITMVEVVVVLVILVALFATLTGPVMSAREAARRNSCVCHGKGIGLAVHNHYDVFKRFPNSTSTRLRRVRPGCARPLEGAEPAGYSWQVRVLPYLEEVVLYSRISKASDKFQRPAFDPVMKIRDAEGREIHPAHASFGFFRCPSSSGPQFSDAPEYAEAGAVEGSTYVAIAATTFDRLIDAEDEEAADGIICPAPQQITFDDIKDGSSKTLLWTETREPRYASWYDGTVSWTVGAHPDDGAVTAMAAGDAESGARPFVTVQRHGAIQKDWIWGPSSEHSGNVVIHGVADGSVRAFTTDMDRQLYLQLITRAGQEKVNLPE